MNDECGTGNKEQEVMNAQRSSKGGTTSGKNSAFSILNFTLLERLVAPDPRLPWLIDWLTCEVWSDKRFADMTPEEYLIQGEKLVHNVEELLSSAAGRVYDELATAAKSVKPLIETLVEKTAVVVFDGASIREAPLFRQKAEQSGFRVVESSISYAALPSETVDFADMQTLYDAAWKNTVMQVPRGRRIVVTSDHGYIFFGAGFESTRSSDACSILDQDRSKRFDENETLPNEATNRDLQVFPEQRLAMVRGRIKNRPRGPSANLVYRHGGLSLMEMIVPWIVLERK